MPGYRIISSDNHVFEPADLWTTRAEPTFRDRAPRVVREADGDWWYCDNHRVIGMGAGAQTGMRFGQSDQLRRTTTFDHVRPGGYIPPADVKNMDAGWGGERKSTSPYSQDSYTSFTRFC